MKKALAIALMIAIVFTVASGGLAIVNRDPAPTENYLAFDGISISTEDVMKNVPLASAASIADKAAKYYGNQLIFGYLKFSYNENRLAPNGSDIVVNVGSSTVSFSNYMNNNIVTHYTDVYGMLQLPTGPNRPTCAVSSSPDEIIVTAPVKMVTDLGTATGYQNMRADSSGRKATELYVGFTGMVKASTSATGTIKAYVTVAKREFDNTFGYVGASHGSLLPGHPPYDGYAYYIDSYANGAHKYRVYKLDDGKEYVVRPVTNSATGELESWGMGFKSGPKYFDKVTYYGSIASNGDLGKDSAVWSQGGQAYFDQRDPANPSYTESNKLTSKLNAIMAFYGFSFTYNNALRDADFSAKAGYNMEKYATYRYFGSTVTGSDNGIVVPQTGDNTAGIVITLLMSAALAAAALLFVMKRAAREGE